MSEKKRARAARVERQNVLLSTAAGQRALELNRFLGSEGVTNDPEFRIFKRINRLDRRIERNQIEGDRLAARRNLIERENLLKKLEKDKQLEEVEEELLDSLLEEKYVCVVQVYQKMTCVEQQHQHQKSQVEDLAYLVNL